FSGIFDGESDEVSLEALGQQRFLQTVRDLVGESAPPAEIPTLEPNPDPRLKLAAAGIQFLEALAEMLGQNGTANLPPDLSLRAANALRRILGEREENDREQ